MVESFWLNLFGSPRLKTSQDQSIAVGRRGRGMLCYLALARDRKASRDRLCTLFWEDRGRLQARASLRQTILELRAALPEGAGDPICADRESVWLTPELLTTDLDLIERTSSVAEIHAALVAIATEPALDGLHFGESFEDWRSGVIPVLERRLRARVLLGIDVAGEAGDHKSVIDLADAWRARDPLDEAMAAKAVAAEMASGDRSAAERRYRDVTRLVKSELGTEPDACIVAALDTPSPQPPASAHAPPLRSPADTDIPAQPAAPRAAKARAWPWPAAGWRAYAAIVAALLLMAASLSMVAKGPGSSASVPAAIAVIPFLVASGSEQEAAFARGLSDDVIDNLTADPRLRVMGPASASRLAALKSPGAFASERLNVPRLLTGVVRAPRGASRVEVDLSLLDTRTGSVVWRRTLRAAEPEIASMAQDAALQVTRQLLADPSALLARPRPKNLPSPSAYRLVLLARQHIHSREANRLVTAWELARRAVELAPQWAEAHATRAIAASLVQSYTDMPVEPLIAEASAASALAIELDPALPDAYEALSFTLEYTDPDKALAAASRAVLLQPGNVTTRRRLAWLLRGDGQYRQAITELESAISIDPLWFVLYCDLGITLAETNEPGRVNTWQARYAELNPPLGERDAVRASMLIDTGRLGEAALLSAGLMRREPEITYAALTWVDALTMLFGTDGIAPDYLDLNSHPATGALARGDFAAAIRLSAPDQASSSNDPEAELIHIYALAAAGQGERIVGQYRRRFATAGSYAVARSLPLTMGRHPGIYIAFALDAAGDRAEAQRVRRKVADDIARLHRLGLATSRSAIVGAQLAVMDGRPADAIQRLEAGLSVQWTAVCQGPIRLEADPVLRRLVGTPRFDALVERCRRRVDEQRLIAGLPRLRAL